MRDKGQSPELQEKLTTYYAAERLIKLSSMLAKSNTIPSEYFITQGEFELLSPYIENMLTEERWLPKTNTDSYIKLSEKPVRREEIDLGLHRLSERLEQSITQKRDRAYNIYEHSARERNIREIWSKFSSFYSAFADMALDSELLQQIQLKAIDTTPIPTDFTGFVQPFAQYLKPTMLQEHIQMIRQYGKQYGYSSMIVRTLLPFINEKLDSLATIEMPGYANETKTNIYAYFKNLIYPSLLALEMHARFLTQGGMILEYYSPTLHNSFNICTPLSPDQRKDLHQLTHHTNLDEIDLNLEHLDISQDKILQERLKVLASEALSKQFKSTVTFNQVFPQFKSSHGELRRVRTLMPLAKEYLVGRPLVTNTQGELTNQETDYLPTIQRPLLLPASDIGNIYSLGDSLQQYVIAFHSNRSVLYEESMINNHHNFHYASLENYPVLLDAQGQPVYSAYVIKPGQVSPYRLFFSFLTEIAALYGTAIYPKVAPEGREDDPLYEIWRDRFLEKDEAQNHHHRRSTSDDELKEDTL